MEKNYRKTERCEKTNKAQVRKGTKGEKLAVLIEGLNKGSLNPD